ncbi:MAG TPA: SpoIIE family protein phosphatase [Vicinamibacterales bacterium]|nr:SpoIIE family protein phosphatase [Vicinamibacterales bacterium]
MSAALPPGPVPDLSMRTLLLYSWAGRLFLAAAAVKVIVALIRAAGEVPAFVRILSTAATIGLIISVGYFVWHLIVLMKRRLLWRVRRKLILSYIFIGVVPALLIVGFFLLGAIVMSMNISAYLFRDGYDDIVTFARVAAEGAASEIARTPERTADAVARIQRNTSRLYRGLSMAFVPAVDRVPAARAGEWDHLTELPAIPEWLTLRADGFAGTTLVPAYDAQDEVMLVVRAAVPSISETRRLGWVIVDVPVDSHVLDGLHEATGVRGGRVSLTGGSSSIVGELRPADRERNTLLFGTSVTILDAVDWPTGNVRSPSIANTYRLRELYGRLSTAQSVQLRGDLTVSDAFLLVLGVVATLFLLIQIAALVMGLALARSITSSIHELFMGTERVRQGDFTHRINIQTNDQLGELAASFNQMTGSIENLLLTAAEKKRLDEELRIARQIQMSLLPRGPLDVPGMAITALCVPAREVGGDYYDFFTLPQDRLGILIADVSGKGTSAALYMAELKGLVLSLSQIYLSPRQLLLEVNRIISDNLDSRSFITMTYAVLDLRARVMTYARAGHTPMIHLTGSSEPSREAHMLVPDGMVVGLRIEGAAQKFAELLEEEEIPLQTGDVIVLYTDGITEAMDAESDLFGDARLRKLIEEHGHLDSGELRERILREIESFVGGADQHDDMTMILIKVEQVGTAVARVAV